MTIVARAYPEECKRNAEDLIGQQNRKGSQNLRMKICHVMWLYGIKISILNIG
jgi:hypothetical protein